MTDFRDHIITRFIGTTHKPEPTIDEVERQANDMNIIDKTMETARKLSGTDTFQEELRRKEKKMEEIEEEKKKVEKQLQESRIEIVQKELGGKLDHVMETMKGGASTKSLGQEIAEIKRTASELGIGESKVSELKNMADLINSFKPSSKGLAEQIREAKELLDIIKPERESEISGVPASVMLQMKQIDADLKLRLEQMADEREDRRQNFELRIKQWEEDREIKRDEISAKLKIEQDRNALIGSSFERLGRVFAQATSEGPAPGSRIASQSAPTPVIEAGEGEFGEISCPQCRSSVPIARDAVRAICPGCGQKYDVKRTPAEVSSEIED